MTPICRSQVERNGRTYRCDKRYGHAGSHEGPGVHIYDWQIWPRQCTFTYTAVNKQHKCTQDEGHEGDHSDGERTWHNYCAATIQHNGDVWICYHDHGHDGPHSEQDGPVNISWVST